MLGRIVGIGLLAGVLSGLATSAIQHFTTVPLIHSAEVYEKSGESGGKDHHSALPDSRPHIILVHSHDAPAADAKASAPKSDAPAEWEPAEGFERIAFTTLATVGAAIGFALMLSALMLASGAQINPRNATLWGLAGFVATGLAPALGLPPELPGGAAADLVQRQIWWVATAAATAAGIWLLFQSRSAIWRGFGPVLLVLPHLIGAPHATAFKSTAPAELAGHFTAASLAVHAILWVLVGAALGALWQRHGWDAEHDSSPA